MSLYLNVNGALEQNAAWETSEIESTTGVAWGDVDNDGDLDLATSNGINVIGGQQNRVYVNTQLGTVNQANNIPAVRMYQPGQTNMANFYASAEIITDTLIPISYTLYDQESDPIGEIDLYYSLNGSGDWQTALPTTNTVTINLASSPYPTATITNTHIFTWNTFANSLFGQSDNIVLRLVAKPQPSEAASPGSFLYRNSIGGTYQRPYASTTSFPFRVRGTQVQVYTDTMSANNELANALVYRLPAGHETGATFMANTLTDEPWRTDQNGYLQGRGELGLGDKLIALYPTVITQNYTIYNTSAAVLPAGLSMHEVITPGVQQLVVSPDNTLILFNLVVSLEWDARQDSTFLNQLQNDLRRASTILYDISNGQAALGNIHIYHDKGYWGHANIVIRASNRQRPSAALGGIVLTPTHDIGFTSPDVTTTSVITGAYIPGQIAMPPLWNRFGDPDGILGEDWPSTLAHELGHYLFFVPDNYLGLNAQNRLIIVDCPGSIMTDPYQESYSEFLTQAEWEDQSHSNPDPNVLDCDDTLAEKYLGRSDWETITFRQDISTSNSQTDTIKFWPMLNGTDIFTGPNVLPMATTQITIFEHTTPTMPIAAPFFNLVDSNGSSNAIPSGQGDAYLIKTHDDGDSTNDYIISLGTPVGNLVQARGAAKGDRLCVYDYSHDPFRFGCLESVGTVATSVMLKEMPPNWQPQVQVTPINSTTVSVTVTNVPSSSQLYVQLLPALGKASAEISMTQTISGFQQIISAPDGAYYGHLRIWAEGSNPHQEMIIEFVGIEDWGGQAYAWGGQAYAWGGQAYAWGAPVMSGDGQVSIFPLENLFGTQRDFTLQKLPLAPELPSWLLPVGQAYRVTVAGEMPDSDILFRYLGADVPSGQEANLRIYYSPDEGITWQRLDKEPDRMHNHISAPVQGEGIYILVATIETPQLRPGWNLWAYPPTDERPVALALASISNSYTSVYHEDPLRTPRWLLYDQTVRPAFGDLVNDLLTLQAGKVYWIYALEETAPYIGPPRETALSTSKILEFPPATFYGWITSTANFAPQIGDPVRAYIGGHLCGQSVVTDTVGVNQLAYKIQVMADNGNDCGVIGREITFVVAGQVMPNNHIWYNSQACYLSLGIPSPEESTCFFFYRIYLPIAWDNFTQNLAITPSTFTENIVQLVIGNQGQPP